MNNNYLRKKKERHQRIRLGVLIVSLLLLSSICFRFFTNNETVADRKTTSKLIDTNIATSIDSDVLTKVKKIDNEMKKNSASSTLENPYVKLDPYDRAPLSAVIIFHTKEKAKVSFTINGKTSNADIKKTINSYKTTHELPIVGLYADYENTVEIEVTREDGYTTTKTVTIQTDSLPSYIPTISIDAIDEEKIDIGEHELTFAIPSTKYVVGFDVEGDIRWYSSQYNSHVFQELKNGHILYLGKDNNSSSSYNRLYEIDYVGKVYQAYKISANAAVSEQEGMESTIVHHDAIELPNGNLLLTVNDGSGKYVEDTMIEINRKTGEIVKIIDLKDLLPESFYKDYTSTTKENGEIDWFHQNSVVYDESDDSIIISGRNQDIVMKLDYQTTTIKWILADSEGWPEEYKKYLIKGTSDNFKYTGGQHAAVILPDSDKNKDTIDILVYDNNIPVTRGRTEESDKYSAATQYRINEKTKEAQIVWTYGKERGENLYTRIVGSARQLEDSKNILINFGWVNSGTKSHIVEVDNETDANVVFEAILSDFPNGAWSYRAERMSLYPEKWNYTTN